MFGEVRRAAEAAFDRKGVAQSRLSKGARGPVQTFNRASSGAFTHLQEDFVKQVGEELLGLSERCMSKQSGR